MCEQFVDSGGGFFHGTEQKRENYNPLAKNLAHAVTNDSRDEKKSVKTKRFFSFPVFSDEINFSFDLNFSLVSGPKNVYIKVEFLIFRNI